MKFLIIGMIIFFVWQIYFRIKRLREKNKNRPKVKSAASITMLRCNQCGTHIPENEVIRSNQGVYCCEQHRRDAEFSK